VSVEILNRLGKRCGIVQEKSKAGVAVATKKAALTVGFVTVITGKGLRQSTLQFVLFESRRKYRSAGLGSPMTI
jgi:hypothetical protein